MTPTTIAIHGAAGRMGRRLVALGSLDPELKIVAAVDSASCPDLGKDADENSQCVMPLPLGHSYLSGPFSGRPAQPAPGAGALRTRLPARPR